MFYWRFFHITTGPLFDKLNRILQIRADVQKKYREFQESTGILLYGNRHNSVSGCMVPAPVDSRVWGRANKKDGLRMPRKDTVEGKQMQALLEALPPTPGMDKPIIDLGFDDMFLGDAERGGYHPAYGPTIMGPLEDTSYFVRLPWREVEPEVLAQYKIDHAAGTTFNSTYAHLLVQIPEEMVVVKEWEMLKALDEHNEIVSAQVRAKVEADAAALSAGG